MTRHELFDELEAFDPRYQQHYPTLRAAAEAAHCVGLLEDYLHTAQGNAYRRDIESAPDVLGAIKAMQESADRLPYRLDNIGVTREVTE